MKYYQILLLAVAPFVVFNSNSVCNETEKSDSKSERKNFYVHKIASEEPGKELDAPANDKTYCGIYVAEDPNKPLEDYVLKNPDIEGVIISINWNVLQPEENKFDWTQLDSDSKKIVAAGKKIRLAITAGKHSPDWIYQHKIRKLDFMESPQEGQSGKIIPVSVPVVWDKDYVEIWETLIQKVADHLKSNEAVWNAFNMIKISGINERTDETRLPAQNELTIARGKSTHAASIWQNAGYRPELVFKVWQRFLDAYAKNFPGKVMVLSVIPGHAFPTIDNSGNLGRRKQIHDLTEDLIEDGISRYKGRFAVQYNSLYDTGGTPEMVVKAGNRGAFTGFQLNHIKLANPACLETHTPCDEEMFRIVLDNGITHGACWIEIFQRDVLAYPKSIAYGRNKLK